MVGPDEYKEHVNDNAFTNYMAYWNIGIAMEYYERIKEEFPEKFRELNEKLQLEEAYGQWKQRRPRMFLPQPGADLVIPQDASYLTYPVPDLKKYKEAEEVGTLFRDYNLEQVNKLQVSKQADIMALFFLLEDRFLPEVKRANWNYYEPKTLHDSSLSLSTHVILACDMGDRELAYKLFQRAVRIDAGENMKSSDAGIHAASLAGIWQGAVFGFGGVRMLNGALRICPSLPDCWESLSFPITWHGQRLWIGMDHRELTIRNETKTAEVEIEIFGKKYQIKDQICVRYDETDGNFVFVA